MSFDDAYSRQSDEPTPSQQDWIALEAGVRNSVIEAGFWLADHGYPGHPVRDGRLRLRGWIVQPDFIDFRNSYVLMLPSVIYADGSIGPGEADGGVKRGVLSVKRIERPYKQERMLFRPEGTGVPSFPHSQLIPTAFSGREGYFHQHRDLVSNQLEWREWTPWFEGLVAGSLKWWQAGHRLDKVFKRYYEPW